MPTPASPPNRRDLRRLAMQVLYQLDLTTGMAASAAPAQTPTDPTPTPTPEDLAEALDEDHDSLPTRTFAAEFALQAWATRATADEKVAALAPEWPTHRQPPVDRAILRLAYYEMVSGHAPIKVAINEAVELAKSFGSEHSPPFINGVLDKLAKTLNTPDQSSLAAAAQPPLPDAPPAPPPPPADEDAWLDDAMDK